MRLDSYVLGFVDVVRLLSCVLCYHLLVEKYQSDRITQARSRISVARGNI